jgi:class 3 adenylate cyclase/streptogramin lyase
MRVTSKPKAARDNQIVTDLPTGTVSLLFTDIEGSTRLQHRLGDRYQEVVAEHRRLLEQAFAEHNGVVVDRQTEAYFVAFPRARNAIAAADAAQRAIAEHEWPDGVSVKVRMGIHSGDPEIKDDRYVGLAVSRAARIAASAHGGQVLVSSSARGLLSDHEQSALRTLGRYRLKDFPEPEPISQLVVDGVPSQFPPIHTQADPSRRKWLLLAIAGLLLVVVAAVVAFTTSGSSAAKIAPTSLAVIDPHTNKVVKAIDLGFKSNLIAAGEGYVWVVDPKGSTLWKIDPHTRRVATIFPLAVGAGDVPFGVAAGGGAVWVAVLRGERQVVLQFGANVGDLRHAIPFGAPVQGPALFRIEPLTVGEDGTVWAIDPAEGGLWRIDPRAARAQKLAEGLDALSLAAGDGAVWVAGSSGVTKIDATSGVQLGSQSVGPSTVAETAAVALGLGAAWYSASSGRTLWKLDPQSLATSQTITVGNGPSGVAVGDGAVWVANSREGTVSRVNPNGGTPKTIKLGQPPGGIVDAYGAVWTSPGQPRS